MWKTKTKKVHRFLWYAENSRQTYLVVIPGRIDKCVLSGKPATRIFWLARQSYLKSINIYFQEWLIHWILCALLELLKSSMLIKAIKANIGNPAWVRVANAAFPHVPKRRSVDLEMLSFRKNLLLTKANFEKLLEPLKHS